LVKFIKAKKLCARDTPAVLSHKYPAPSAAHPVAQGSTNPLPDRFKEKNSVQVETSVAQTVRRKVCGLKPEAKVEKKSATYGVRFKTEELVIVRTKAQLAGCSTNSYIRATVLGSDYKQPINPELQKTLLMLNRELTAQGNNLNQIARHLNEGAATPSQGVAMLDAIRRPLVQALLAVKNALVQKAPQP
jgi:hypothetical protein